MGAIITALATGLASYGVWETYRHEKNLRRIPVRVHVNGTRGKSSVTRLIAAGLRASGRRAFAKTTGTTARMILPDGSEVDVYRVGQPNIIEQTRIVRRAIEARADTLVIECMAVTPELQPVTELRLVQSTVGVITNVRSDHLDVMGPTVDDAAAVLAQTAPRNAPLFTAERERAHLLAKVARERGSELHVVHEGDVSEDDLAGFRYIEHADNVALALAVCRHLGVDRETALRGMREAQPDPGALQQYTVRAGERTVRFVNAFAANDPDSTLIVWNRLGLDEPPDAWKRIVLLNCRGDRVHRSTQLGDLLSEGRIAPDHVVLTGEETGMIALRLVSRGYPRERLSSIGNLDPERIYERLLNLVDEQAVVVGIGNIVGGGEEIVEFIRARAVHDD